MALHFNISGFLHFNISPKNSLQQSLLSFSLGSAMAIHAHRRGEESNDSLQQRFKKQVQKTGILKMLRERSTHKRTPTRRLVRLRALKREGFRKINRKKQFYSNM